MTIIMCVAVLITLQIWWEIREIKWEVKKHSKDIRAMNRIIKRLQAANGMIADGIDKAGK